MSKKENLEKKKKLQKLKSRAEEVKKSAGQMQDESEQRFKKLTGREMNPEERKDAWLENQAAARYPEGGVSPIYAKGKFSSTTPKDHFGNTGITQDDSDRIAKKKKKK